MKVLVTGATSLLGGAIVRLLVDRDDAVSVFQRGPTDLGVAETHGDVADAVAVRRAVAGADAVVHVAGLVSTVGPWSSFERTNVVGTRNVVAAALERGVGRVVFISSPSVAHSGASLVGVGAGRANPDTARGNYARSKAEAELLALDANCAATAVVAVRPHLIWGPGDTQLVGRIVERARSGRLAIVGPGMSLIDTIYIDNAASAAVAALDRAPEIGGQAFVVTNGQPRPVREIVNRIVSAAGLEPPRLRVPFLVAKVGGGAAERMWEARDLPGEPPMTRFLAEQLATAHWFDQRETRAKLQWSPHVSLDEGFVRLEQWFGSQQ